MSPGVLTTIAPDVQPRDTVNVHDLVEVRANHARRHQVRAHLAAAGHPLLGDVLYGGPAIVADKKVTDATKAVLSGKTVISDSANARFDGKEITGLRIFGLVFVA